MGRMKRKFMIWSLHMFKGWKWFYILSIKITLIFLMIRMSCNIYLNPSNYCVPNLLKFHNMVIIIVTQLRKLFWIVKNDLSMSSVILSLMLYCKSSSIRIINSWHKNHCALNILKFKFNPRLLIFGSVFEKWVKSKL